MVGMKNYLTLAFTLFFGGLFVAGIGLALVEGVVGTLMVGAGVLLTVVAPVSALMGASAEESHPRAI